jgi:CAAX protease family protein
MDANPSGERRKAGARPLLPPAPWSPLEAVGVFVVALVVGAILAAGALAMGNCAAQQALTALAGEAALAVVVIGWVRIAHRAPPAVLGLRPSGLADVLIGLAGGGALLVAGWAVLALVTVVATSILGHSPSQPEQVAVCVRGSWLYGLGPIVVFAAPFAEELFFRGFLYRGLRRRMTVWPSAVLSGVLFGLAHLQGASFLLIVPPLCVVGIGLALIFEYRQTLVASMSAHALFNLFGFVTIAWSRR